MFWHRRYNHDEGSGWLCSLCVAGIFSGNMTGNVTSLADRIATGDPRSGLSLLAIIVLFIVGAMLSALLLEFRGAGNRARLRNAVTRSWVQKLPWPVRRPLRLSTPAITDPDRYGRPGARHQLRRVTYAWCPLRDADAARESRYVLRLNFKIARRNQVTDRPYRKAMRLDKRSVCRVPSKGFSQRLR